MSESRTVWWWWVDDIDTGLECTRTLCVCMFGSYRITVCTRFCMVCVCMTFGTRMLPYHVFYIMFVFIIVYKTYLYNNLIKWVWTIFRHASCVTVHGHDSGGVRWKGPTDAVSIGHWRTFHTPWYSCSNKGCCVFDWNFQAGIVSLFLNCFITYVS